ncbi:AAA family ATPase [Clostridium sp.]|uniref:AAA family ATPase n=1 Tax=Clostridium sp. TaxID=1506 RepID=UPI00321623F1
MKELEFKGTIIRETYSSKDYKMYAIDVDREEYPDIKFTKYGNAVIGGNLHSLTPDMEYFIKATEKVGSKGYMYNVTNIKKTQIKSEKDCYEFLQEILTFNQASVLYQFYPNIVDLIINGEENEVDLSKLKGIKEYTFNCIKEKIVENYALYDLINEFHGVLTLSMLKKLYNKYPSIEKIRTELRCRPYKTLCGLSRVGFKTADSLLQELEKDNCIKFEYDLKTSKERCLACMTYFLEENETNGNTKMSIPDLRKQVLKLTPACANHFVSCLKENKEIYYDKKTMDVALTYTYATELLIATTIDRAIKIKSNWNLDWKSYQNQGEFPLSDEQLKALDLICSNQIVILSGYAGSGKTATTNTLIKMMLDNNKTFMLVAPTGRAAKVLKGYTGQPAATIHRAYGYMPPDEWEYNEENKICKDLVIVDEASMSDVFLFKHLIDGIDFNKTKLLIIGDPAQLCSVGAGNVLNDMISSNKIPIAMLTKIFRYSEGGLMQVATDTRNCKMFLKEKQDKYIFLGKNKDYGFRQCSNGEILKHAAELYKKLLTKGILPGDIMVLTSQNKGEYGTIAINNILQRIANKNYGSNDYIQIGDVKYYKDDIVLQTVNNYRAKIYVPDCLFEIEEPIPKTMIANGELGTIKEINNLYAVIDFDGVLVKYTKSDIENISLGYSISTHKSQGGSAKIVIFLTPSAHTFMLNSNLIYVGLTRTKERCFHLGDLTTVNRAIKKKENLMRNTSLLKFLEKIKTN